MCVCVCVYAHLRVCTCGGRHTWQIQRWLSQALFNGAAGFVGGAVSDRGIVGALLSIDSRWSMLDEDDWVWIQIGGEEQASKCWFLCFVFFFPLVCFVFPTMSIGCSLKIALVFSFSCNPRMHKTIWKMHTAATAENITCHWRHSIHYRERQMAHEPNSEMNSIETGIPQWSIAFILKALE